MALLKDNQEILMSGEELFRRPDLGPCELVNGRVIPLAPTGHGHGLIEARLTAPPVSAYPSRTSSADSPLRPARYSSAATTSTSAIPRAIPAGPVM